MSHKFGSQSPSGGVNVTNWNACHNSGEDIISLSCTVTAADSSAGITGVGVILNTNAGATLGSSYNESSGGSASATPAINLPTGGLKAGDSVMGVVSGECNGQHFFFEKELTIGNC
jgi:hypothetical protein